jgi:hypothetical protein
VRHGRRAAASTSALHGRPMSVSMSISPREAIA